jgi:pyrrolidone-carboxylate peptidase
MNILIYWFWAYKKYKTNITEKIINNLGLEGVEKLIFPVEFDHKIFLDKINEINPDLILWLWQHPRINKIRIERKTHNIKSQSRKIKWEEIFKWHEKSYITNLKIKSDNNSYISYNAWKYVCNFSMYIIMKFFWESKKFWFVHIPKDYNVNKASKFIKTKLKQIQEN